MHIRHEEVAAFAASGEAKVTGTLVVYRSARERLDELAIVKAGQPSTTHLGE